MRLCNFCKNSAQTHIAATTARSIALLTILAACNPLPQTQEPSVSFDQRAATDDVIYFLVTDRFENGDPGNDRGDLDGDRLQTGFDPEDEKFYHGGDLLGLTQRLDYLQELGVTAIWITPVFRNLPVQQFGPWLTASYHGYWIADFMRVDPHLGTEEDLRNLVTEAHRRDIKVILDIVVNHTAHVIKYRECHDPDYTGPGKEGPADACVYRDSNEYPDTAYTPYVDAEHRGVKNPAWLNEVAYYHNRGELNYAGESFYWGDFSGLDDLYTEHPRVIDGMTDIYKYWVEEFGIDGYRIDTTGHVNTSFFETFSPAILTHAAAHDRPNFFMFGEVVNTLPDMRRYTAEGKLPAVLDFNFQEAVVDYVANAGSARQLASFFDSGDFFIDADTSPYQLPTFLGNHDLGRFAVYLKMADPNSSDDTNLRRSTLAHAILFFGRGIPVLYYGDEQGFITDPGFHESREDMFPSKSALYNEKDLIGTDRTTADDNFDRRHPLYEQIRELSATYHEHPALRRGDQIERYAEDGPGVFAFSRIDATERIEYLVLVNNSHQEATARVPTSSGETQWSPVVGNTEAFSPVADSIDVKLAPFAFAVYRAANALPLRETEPSIEFAQLSNGDTLDCSEFIVALPSDQLTHVEFSATANGDDWQSLGTDREPPFRIRVDPSTFPPDSTITIRARTRNYARLSAEKNMQLRTNSDAEYCE